MAEVYNFLRTYEVLLYILLAIGGLFAFRWLWRSWRESQTAVYTLERQFSSRRLAQSAAISALIVVLFCAEFFMASFYHPGAALGYPCYHTNTGFDLHAHRHTLCRNDDPICQSPPAGSGYGLTGCVPNKIILTSPKAGDEIKGTIELIGTVDIPNFGFYKYEVARAGSDTWATISADRKTVTNGRLGGWNTTSLTPGDYQLRLVVTDNQGAVLPPCVVPVRIVPIQ